MPTITISGTVIDFPESYADPNWSTAIIQFAEVVESALNSVAGTYDIPPQSEVLSGLGPDTVPLNTLSFPENSVRAFNLDLVVERTLGTPGIKKVLKCTMFAYQDFESGLWKWSTQYLGDSWIFNLSVVSSAGSGIVYYNRAVSSTTATSDVVSYKATTLPI